MKACGQIKCFKTSVSLKQCCLENCQHVQLSKTYTKTVKKMLYFNLFPCIKLCFCSAMLQNRKHFFSFQWSLRHYLNVHNSTGYALIVQSQEEMLALSSVCILVGHQLERSQVNNRNMFSVKNKTYIVFFPCSSLDRVCCLVFLVSNILYLF